MPLHVPFPAERGMLDCGDMVAMVALPCPRLELAAVDGHGGHAGWSPMVVTHGGHACASTVEGRSSKPPVRWGEG